LGLAARKPVQPRDHRPSPSRVSGGGEPFIVLSSANLARLAKSGLISTPIARYAPSSQAARIDEPDPQVGSKTTSPSLPTIPRKCLSTGTGFSFGCRPSLTGQAKMLGLAFRSTRQPRLQRNAHSCDWWGLYFGSRIEPPLTLCQTSGIGST